MIFSKVYVHPITERLRFDSFAWRELEISRDRVNSNSIIIVMQNLFVSCYKEWSRDSSFI